jgi:hypothetical protein
MLGGIGADIEKETLLQDQQDGLRRAGLKMRDNVIGARSGYSD